MTKQPLTDKDGEVRELTLEDFKLFRPLHEIDPAMVDAADKPRRRPPVQEPKVHIGFPLSADVADGTLNKGEL